MEVDFKDNKDRKRFETEVNGHTAFVEYIRAKNAIYLTHTEVPGALEGKGVGSALVKRALEQIKQEGEKVAPLCPFVAAYIKKHRDWIPMVASGYHVG
jgi:predicted GNAT family acetyltransferase